MRYSPDYKARARKKVLDTAGSLAKQNGFGTTGVDALMAAAGFTTGAFYSHFGSRAELLKAIVENELQRTVARFKGKDKTSLHAALKFYLSSLHIDHPEAGCLLPALSNEVARAGEPTRASFEDLLVQLKAEIEPHVQRPGEAWAVIAQAVGAVLIARALATDAVRAEVLQAAQDNIGAILDADRS